MDLNDLRLEIDKIDREMVELFCKRMAISVKVSQYKIENSLPVLDANRERKKLAKISEMAGEDMASYARTLYNTIFDLSRAEQEKYMHPTSPTAEKIKRAIETTPKIFPDYATVACQGVEGAYSQIAAEKLFKVPDISYYGEFEDVFIAVKEGRADYGVLPLENSTAGSVNMVYDLMMKYNFFIVRQTRVHIDHQLLAKKGTRAEDIKEVFSHPQAISQCADFLRELGVKVTPCQNTAAAAKMVAKSERDDIAALSSRSCASLYNLDIIGSSVQDKGNNHTRFICISKKREIYPGADKTSIMAVTPHRPGALFRVMSRFNALGINLAKLESRPIPDRDFEFMFYFDLETSVYSPEFLQLICELDFVCEDFRYLGSYSEVI
ncbi:MAG: bifunctional chorismate mutase/prephenate dehydratase [Ruminococcaceae bacterium]|nr:bifunctional chorismate mutase/prephenate dehydratase [Oscillospiraceae bacterium]